MREAPLGASARERATVDPSSAAPGRVAAGPLGRGRRQATTTTGQRGPLQTQSVAAAGGVVPRAAQPVTTLEDAELCSMERGGVVDAEQGSGAAGEGDRKRRPCFDHLISKNISYPIVIFH